MQQENHIKHYIFYIENSVKEKYAEEIKKAIKKYNSVKKYFLKLEFRNIIYK